MRKGFFSKSFHLILPALLPPLQTFIYNSRTDRMKLEWSFPRNPIIQAYRNYEISPFEVKVEE